MAPGHGILPVLFSHQVLDGLCGMVPHRYAVGQIVEFVPGSMVHAAWRGAYVVVRRLDGPPHREAHLRFNLTMPPALSA